MKKIISLILLLILPLIFSIVFYKYQNALGEYYLGRNYDPSYPYLINSLNLSQFKGYGVGHIDHPGITVKELGAIVILIVHTFKSNGTDMTKDVFNNPEYYLNKIFQSLLILISTAIYLLGITVYKKLKSIRAALFLQLTPFSFFSKDIFFQITNVSVEPVLVLILLLLLTLIISYLNKDGSNRNLLIYTVVFGVLCGMGMATKISFFPVLIIPFLIIRKIKFQGLFILITIITFAIFLLTAFTSTNVGDFIIWVENLATHSGKYGKGNEDIVEASFYFENIRTIFLNNFIFSLSYILLWITFILQFFKKYKTAVRSNKYYFLMSGILFAMTIQILLVAKHFSLYYMIPVFMFSILGLFIVHPIIFACFPGFFKNKFKNNLYYTVITILIAVLLSFYIRFVKREISLAGNDRNEAHKIVKSIEENYENSLVVSTYGSSSKEFALFLGCFYGGTQTEKYFQILKEMYPQNFYFNKWDNNFYDLGNSNLIKSQFINTNKFIFQGANEEIVTKFMNTVREITNKNGASSKKILSDKSDEVLYEVILE